MLRRKGVRVVSITEHADDTPTGKLMEAIIESVDEFNSENLAQEVTRGMREAASRGFWISSHAPYGYNRVMVQDGPKKRPTLEIDPDVAPTVKRMYDMAEAGNGTLEIIRTLNNEGIASPRGKLWARTSVHNILTNEAYTGTLAQEVTRGMREAASPGFWMTTYAPYGYKRVHVQDGAAKRPKLELNPPADAVARRIFDMALGGRSTLDIAKTLNAGGIPTS